MGAHDHEVPVWNNKPTRSDRCYSHGIDGHRDREGVPVPKGTTVDHLVEGAYPTDLGNHYHPIKPRIDKSEILPLSTAPDYYFDT